jgi:hypothetical protein
VINFSTTLLHGLLIAIPFSLFALISFWSNPRLWLHSLPEDIQQKTDPKTKRERNLTRFVLLPLVVLILPGLSIVSLIYIYRTMEIDFTFTGALLHLYGIWIFVHLWDLVIIDGISMMIIDKNNPPIKGTEGAEGWKDFNFHFRAFIKATMASAVFVVPAAFFCALLA